MSEAQLESLHFADAPRITSSALPGPKTLEPWHLSARTESMARGGGRMPVAMDRASADFMISSTLMDSEYERIVPDYDNLNTQRLKKI